jgi:hypothetical protein
VSQRKCETREEYLARERRYKASPTGKVAEYRSGARKRGIAWQLTNAEAFNLFERPCHWCGTFPGGGIDRLNNEPYYCTKNSVPCCSTCNRAKLTSRANDFLAHVEAIISEQYRDLPPCPVEHIAEEPRHEIDWYEVL